MIKYSGLCRDPTILDNKNIYRLPNAINNVRFYARRKNTTYSIANIGNVNSAYNFVEQFEYTSIKKWIKINLQYVISNSDANLSRCSVNFY